jgi:hypothetical protein
MNLPVWCAENRDYIERTLERIKFSAKKYFVGCKIKYHCNSAGRCADEISQNERIFVTLSQLHKSRFCLLLILALECWWTRPTKLAFNN